MSLEYKILGQELVSYTTVEGTTDTTSYYVSYEETRSPIFVGVGVYSDRAVYSFDGITWNETIMPYGTNGTKYSVVYGNGRFIAVGNEISAYSTDGINWTSFYILNQNTGWPVITYGGGKFVALSYSSPIAASSADGVTWTISSTPGSIWWESIAYGAGTFFGLGSNSRSAYSLDGISWTEVTMPEGTSFWSDVTYGGGKFVAIPDNLSLGSYSIDGITWSQFNLPANANWNSVTYGDGKFVAVARDSSLFAYSLDGINWIAGTMPGPEWSSVTYGNGKFVALSYDNTPSYAAYSIDGISWTLGVLSTNKWWFDVAYGETVQLTETLNIIGGQGTSSTEEFLPVTFYTVPAGKQTTVTSVFVANQNNTATTYDFAVVPAGEELSLKHHLRWDMEIAANDFESISTKITMSEGDSLVIFPSTVDTVSVTAFGVEK